MRQPVRGGTSAGPHQIINIELTDEELKRAFEEFKAEFLAELDRRFAA
jgi:hypothetical protein